MSGDGSQDIVAQLNRIEDGLAGAIPVEAGLEWIEVDATPAARAIVPIDTGALQASIGGEPGPGGVTMFAEEDYAEDVERGTSKMPARPYLLPAIRTTLPALGRALAGAIERRKS